MFRYDAIKQMALVLMAALAVGLGACGGSGGSAAGLPDAGALPGEGDGGAPDEGCADEGCACTADDECADALLCDLRSRRCRAPLGCDDLSCEVHRECLAAEDGDARCGDCVDGYRWDDVQGRCQSVPSCDPAAPGSIVQSCAADNRQCDDSGAEPRCGACLEGSAEVAGHCVADTCDTLPCPSPQVCTEDDGGASCAACEPGYVWSESARRCLQTCAITGCRSDERCVEATAGQDAFCAPRTGCDEGQVDNGQGVCLACEKCYQPGPDGAPVPREGVVGIAHGGVAWADICVCDVAPGYFQSLTGDVRACDADGDGWHNRRSTVLAGTPFADEAQCTPSYIDRFVLHSDDLVADSAPEVPARLEVTIEHLSEIFPLDPGTWEVRDGVAVMALVEDESLDQADGFRDRYEDPANGFHLRPYGDGAARFRPEHANPLTKICNHDGDDFNMDGLSDVSQAQGMPVPASRPGAWAYMSFFLELAEGRYEPGDGAFGRYVIRERPRSGLGAAPLPFPMDTSTPGGVYEASCLRSRDAAFPGLPDADTAPAPGFDFAHFQCDAGSGGCAVLDPRAPGHAAAYDGRLPQHVDALERYAQAENGGVAVPWDTASDRVDGAALWPGMNHHSQFKCVTSDSEASPYRRTETLNHDGTWDRYQCSLQATSEPGQPPEWRCEPSAEMPPGNHWAVARHEPYAPGGYERGCIDEASEWGFACEEWTATWGPGRDFETDGLFSGRFTCQTECARDGRFLATEDGAVCCYGDEAGLGQCTYDNFTSPEGHTLLCALPGHAAPPAGAQLCSEALGAFRWAAPNGGGFDPNTLKWAPAVGESVQMTRWQ